jgi:crossover junction endodeoxyribonuclease RusA
MHHMKELILPWPSSAMSPNARGHWTARRKAAEKGRLEGRIVALDAGWRESANTLPDGRWHLWITFYPPTKRLPDDDNMLARFKAYRDGLADALGVDDSRFVSHPYVKEEVRKGGQVVVRITGGPQ